MIQVTQIEKQFHSRTVLDIPSLRLFDGERLALIGPNGCGKSTFLRIMAGTLPPDRGKIDWGGLTPADVGYLPQRPFAFDMTVLENVMLPMRGMHEKRREAMKWLARVGLAGLAEVRAKTLSGGELQRMALARLLAVPHRLLLLDEPTSAVDLYGAEVLEQMILDYCGQNACTLLFSSHAPAQTLRLGMRAIMLWEGEVVESGPVAEVIHRPKREETKCFLRNWTV